MSIEARFKDNDALREFIRRILPAIPGLTVTHYTLVPRILRNIDEWIPPREDFGLELSSNRLVKTGWFFVGLRVRRTRQGGKIS